MTTERQKGKEQHPKSLTKQITAKAWDKYSVYTDEEMKTPEGEDKSVFENSIAAALEELSGSPILIMHQVLLETGLDMSVVTTFSDLDDISSKSWDAAWSYITSRLIYTYVKLNEPRMIEEESRRYDLFNAWHATQ